MAHHRVTTHRLFTKLMLEINSKNLGNFLNFKLPPSFKGGDFLYREATDNMTKIKRGVSNMDFHRKSWELEDELKLNDAVK